jgi:hypothetical protein
MKKNYNVRVIVFSTRQYDVIDNVLAMRSMDGIQKNN